MKKIIIFTIAPINQDFLKKYGYFFFKNNHIEVIFFNVCNLMYGPEKTKRLRYNNIGQINDVKELKVTSYHQLYHLLKKYREDTIIYMNITTNSRILLLLFLSKVPYIDGSLWGGVQTKDWIEKSIFLTLINHARSFFLHPIRKITRKVNFYFSLFVRYLHPPYLTLTSDPYEVSYYKETKKEDNIILNHTFDYDRFLINKDLRKPSYVPNHEYYLLLPNHAWMIHDYIINDAEKDCVITKEKYENLINKTLDDIESLTGIKILVSGYPVATSEEDIYKDRDFLLGKETEQLVKYSSGVITHFSGAINFAIIHKKPICLINYKIFDGDTRFLNPIQAYSKYLGVPINYLDNPNKVNSLEVDNLFIFNEEKFQDYFFKFICPEQIFKKKPIIFWERVLNRLKSKNRN